MNEESIVVSYCIFSVVTTKRPITITRLASCHVFELILNLVLNK